MIARTLSATETLSFTADNESNPISLRANSNWKANYMRVFRRKIARWKILACVTVVVMLAGYPTLAVAQNSANQRSTGNCSPNIVGGNNTVLCPGNSTGANALASILASIKPSRCSSLTEDQTRAEVVPLLRAADQAGMRGDRILRIRFAQQALGLWLCLPDQDDLWISTQRDNLIGALGMAEYQAGQTGEGCVLITYAYQSARRQNDFDAQRLLLSFPCPPN